MIDDGPVEPSAIIVPSASRLPSPDRLPKALAQGLPATSRRLVPSLVRALTNGNVITASALAVTAITAARAAAIAGRLARPGGGPAWRRAEDLVNRTAPTGGGVHISWTHVEIRWLSGE
jgi:hypothetical protein